MKCILLFSLLVAFVFCTNSGLEIGIDMETFKIVKQINFNKLLANKILLDHAEVNGTMLADYDLVIDNLTMIDIQPPKVFKIDHLFKPDGTPYIKMKLQDLQATVAVTFDLKYGIIKEKGNQTHITAFINSLDGQFYFTPEGNVVLEGFEVDIKKLDIDFESGFIDFIYFFVKGIIKSTIEKEIKKLNELIASSINAWVTSEFLYDLGFGIGFNFTNIDRPKLSPFTKHIPQTVFANIINLFHSFIQEDYTVNAEEYMNTTILTTGIHASVYPNLNPELQADIPPAVDMLFKPENFNNEINLLLSDYTLNTLLFMAQQTGYLHKEFSLEYNPIFPFKFDVQGVSTIIPEFLNKYPEDNFPIQMKVYVSPKKWKQPQLVSNEEETDIVVNFGIDFDTKFSDDDFDDPARDLELNVTMTLNAVFETNNDILNIVVSNPKVTQLVKTVDEIEADEANLVKVLESNVDLLLPMLNKMTKDLKVIELLNQVTGLSFRDFKLDSFKGYHGVSIGFNGLRNL